MTLVVPCICPYVVSREDSSELQDEDSGEGFHNVASDAPESC